MFNRGDPFLFLKKTKKLAHLCFYEIESEAKNPELFKCLLITASKTYDCPKVDAGLEQRAFLQRHGVHEQCEGLYEMWSTRKGTNGKGHGSHYKAVCVSYLLQRFLKTKKKVLQLGHLSPICNHPLHCSLDT